MQSGACSSANSTIGTISVSPATIAGTASGDTTVCSGTNTATLTLSGQTGSVLKWQSSSVNDFSSNVSDIVNATNSLTASNLTTTTYYRAVVQSGACATANSNVVTVTVLPGSAGGTISGDTTLCSGTNSATLTLSGQTGSVVKWQSSTTSDFSSNVSDIVNATNSLTASNLTTTTYYRAVVQSGACSSANSNTATVAVTPTAVGGAVLSDTTVYAGSNTVQLTLVGQTGVVVKWQSSATSDFASPTDIVNATNSLTDNNLTATTYYRAVVQSGLCPVVNSGYATVTVQDTLPTGIISNTAGSSGFVKLYPNPGSKELNVYISSIAAYEGIFIVYDILGNRIEENKISLVKGLNTIMFDFANLAKGSYLLGFTAIDGKTHIVKWIKN